MAQQVTFGKDYVPPTLNPLTYEEAERYLQLTLARVRFNLDLRPERPNYPLVDPDAHWVTIIVPQMGTFSGATLLAAVEQLRLVYETDQARRNVVRQQVEAHKVGRNQRHRTYQQRWRARVRAEQRRREREQSTVA